MGDTSTLDSSVRRTAYAARTVWDSAGKCGTNGRREMSWLVFELRREVDRADGCSTVVLIGSTCPAITVATVILRALDRVRERALKLGFFSFFF